MDQDQAVSNGPDVLPTDNEVSAFLDALDVGPGANLIGLLQQVQDRFGYLPVGALEQIGIAAHTPLSRIYGVVSFYAQFYLSPHGRHTIRVCRGTACHVRGSKQIMSALRRRLKVGPGETTSDYRFTLERVACFGACALAPVVVVDDDVHGKMTPETTLTAIEGLE